MEIELITERGRLPNRGLPKSTVAAKFGGNPSSQYRPLRRRAQAPTRCPRQSYEVKCSSRYWKEETTESDAHERYERHVMTRRMAVRSFVSLSI